MRKIFIILAIFAQIAVLVFMAAERESVIRFGKTVKLRTAPVDPRDPFRGDYVLLSYEISNIPMRIFKGKLPPQSERRQDTIVYVTLKEGADGVFAAEACSLEKPGGGSVFIRGRIDRWSGRVDEQRFIRVKYGIEKFFVKQDSGRDIEERAGRGNQIHIPLEMNVALSESGTAVAKNFKWCPLGIGLEIVEQPTRENFNARPIFSESDSSTESSSQRRSIKVKLTLKNCSDSELAIVNAPDFASFSVEPSEASSKIWNFSHVPRIPVAVSDDDVKILKPEECVDFIFDFAEPRWFVDLNGVSQEIGVASGNAWGTMLRIRYSPPSPEQCANLKNAKLVWHGELISRNFSPNGYID